MADLYSISGLLNDNTSIGVFFGGFFIHGKGVPGNSPLGTNLVGMGADTYGLSNIVGEMAEDFLRFEKKYFAGSYPVHYKFKFDNEKKLWVGEYESNYLLSGKIVRSSVRCKINKDFEGIILREGMLVPEESQ